jgi:hypothetical protein
MMSSQVCLCPEGLCSLAFALRPLQPDKLGLETKAATQGAPQIIGCLACCFDNSAAWPLAHTSTYFSTRIAAAAAAAGLEGKTQHAQCSRKAELKLASQHNGAGASSSRAPGQGARRRCRCSCADPEREAAVLTACRDPCKNVPTLKVGPQYQLASSGHNSPSQ